MIKNIFRPKAKMTAVIILNWNGLKNTIECLNSLIKLKDKNIKILLIDNGSKNDNIDKLSNLYKNEVEIISLPQNIGYAGGVNYGIKISQKFSPNYFLLLNNDTLVTPGFLDELIKTADSEKDIGIVGPQINDFYNQAMIQFVGGGVNWLLAKPFHKTKIDLDPHEETFITGCSMLIKKAVIEKIGLFDERFFAYFEDVSYCLKARKAGYKCVCSTKALIYHKQNATSGKNSKLFTYLFSRNRILFIKHYLPKILLVYFYPFFLLKLIYAFLYFSLTNQQERRAAYLFGFIDGILSKGGRPNI